MPAVLILIAIMAFTFSGVGCEDSKEFLDERREYCSFLERTKTQFADPNRYYDLAKMYCKPYDINILD